MERPKQRSSGGRGRATRVTPGSRSAAFHAVSGPERRAQALSSMVTPSPVKIVAGGKKEGSGFFGRNVLLDVGEKERIVKSKRNK